jgi:hypothetical protein
LFGIIAMAEALTGSIDEIILEAFEQGDVDKLNMLASSRSNEFYIAIFEKGDGDTVALYSTYLLTLFGEREFDSACTRVDVLDWLIKYLNSVGKQFDVDAFYRFEGGGHPDYPEDCVYSLLYVVSTRQRPDNAVEILDWLYCLFQSLGRSLHIPFLHIVMCDVLVIEWYLEHGHSIKFNDHTTDIGILFSEGCLETLELLIQHDRAAVDKYIIGSEAALLEYAAIKGHAPVMEWLKRNGYDISRVNTYNKDDIVFDFSEEAVLVAYEGVECTFPPISEEMRPLVDQIPNGTYFCGSAEVMEWMTENIKDFVITQGTMTFAALTSNYKKGRAVPYNPLPFK